MNADFHRAQQVPGSTAVVPNIAVTDPLNAKQSLGQLEAEEAKTSNIVEMALDFASMTRKFSKGSKPRILGRLRDIFSSLGNVKTVADYEDIHKKFCIWFTQNISVAERKNKKNGETSIPAHPSSYGQTAKVLDIVAKVYVHYCQMPSQTLAATVAPFLHAGLDNQMIERVAKKFPEAQIESRNLEDVGQEKYERLQLLVKQEIEEDFDLQILPVQYDDIFFRRLNR